LLNKTIGDAVMAVFNFPVSHGDHVQRGARITFVKLSWQIVQRLGFIARTDPERTEWNRERTAQRHRHAHLFPAAFADRRPLECDSALQFDPQ